MKLIRSSDIRSKCDSALIAVRSRLLDISPSVEIHEVGSSSIRGSITKGDLDILVIASSKGFDLVRSKFDKYFEINPMDYIKGFKSYILPNPELDIGLQLCKDTDKFGFILFRDILNSDPKLVHQYNQIKRDSTNIPIDDYRSRKNIFIESIIQKYT